MTHELQSRHQPKELLESNPVMKKGSNSLPEAEKNSPIKSRAKVLVETLVGVGVINPKMDTFTFEGGQELAVLPLSRSELNKVVKVFDEFRTTFADFADFAEMCDYDPGKLDQYFQSNSEQLVKLHNSEAVGQGLAQMDDLLKKLADPDEEVDRVVSPKTINEKIILMTRLSNELNPWYERSEDKRATVDTKVPEITRDAEGNLDKVYFDTKSLNPTIVKEMMNLDNKWVLYNSDGILYNTNQLLKDLGLGDLSPDELSSHLAEDGSLAKIRLRRNEISENLKQKLVEVGGVFCVDFKHPDHDQDINQKNKEDPIEPEPQKPEPLAIDGNDFGDSPEPNSIPGLDDETSSEYIEGNFKGNKFLTPESYRQFEVIAKSRMMLAMDKLARTKNKRESIWSSIRKVFGNKASQYEFEQANQEYQEAKIQYQSIVANRIVATKHYLGSPEYLRYQEIMNILGSGQALDSLELKDFKQLIARISLPSKDSLDYNRLSSNEIVLLMIPEYQLGSQDHKDHRQAIISKLNSLGNYSSFNPGDIDLLSTPMDRMDQSQLEKRAEMINKLDQREVQGELSSDLGSSLANLAIFSANELIYIEDRQLDRANMTKVQKASILGDWLRRHPKTRLTLGFGMATFGIVAGDKHEDIKGIIAAGYFALRVFGGYAGATAFQKLVRDRKDSKDLRSQIDQSKIQEIRVTIERLFPDTKDRRLQDWLALNYQFLNNVAEGRDPVLVNQAIRKLSAESSAKIERNTRKVRHGKMAGAIIGTLLGTKIYNSHHGELSKPSIEESPKVSTPIIDHNPITNPVPVDTLDTNQVFTSVVESGHGQTHEIGDIFNEHVAGWGSLPDRDKTKVIGEVARAVQGRAFEPNPSTRDWLWEPGATYSLTIEQMKSAIRKAGLDGVLSIN